MMAARLEDAAALTFSPPVPLFVAGPSTATGRGYDVAVDGRLLMTGGPAALNRLVLLENWVRELGSR